jgi:hypothetical protein
LSRRRSGDHGGHPAAGRRASRIIVDIATTGFDSAVTVGDRRSDHGRRSDTGGCRSITGGRWSVTGGRWSITGGRRSDTGCCRLVAGGHGDTFSRPASTMGRQGHLTCGRTTGNTPGLALELLGGRGASAFRCSTMILYKLFPL